MFRKRNQERPKDGRLDGAPRLPSIMDTLNIVPRILEIFKDNRGKMSSKRFGAGALVASGIVLVDAGTGTNTPVQYWCGLVLCGLGVVLFGLTRFEWKGGGPDEDGGQS